MREVLEAVGADVLRCGLVAIVGDGLLPGLDAVVLRVELGLLALRAGQLRVGLAQLQEVVVHGLRDDAVLVWQSGLASEVRRCVLVIFFEELLRVGLAPLAGQGLQLVGRVGGLGGRGALDHCL